MDLASCNVDHVPRPQLIFAHDYIVDTDGLPVRNVTDRSFRPLDFQDRVGPRDPRGVQRDGRISSPPDGTVNFSPWLAESVDEPQHTELSRLALPA